jgi:branched-chain amino acid transport system ATP-binding protein
MTDSMLAAGAVRMVFGGLVALDQVSIEVRRSRVIGLIGRNGSGKSTLFNCLTGFLKPTSGTIELDGRDITGCRPHDVMRAGIARTFQTPRVDHQMTARDAILCGLHSQLRHGFLASLLALPHALRAEHELQQGADDVIERMRIGSWAARTVNNLSMGRVRTVEVARAIGAKARYLLLDEPAAGLGPEEIGVLAGEIRALAAGGIGVLLVEHNFSMIRMLCDEVTVLDTGTAIFRGTPDAACRDERVKQLYLGAASGEAA